MPLTAEQIKKNPDRRTFPIEIPEWADDQGNCTYRYRILSFAEAQTFRMKFIELADKYPDIYSLSMDQKKEYAKANAEINYWVVARSIIDDSGNRMFTDEDASACASFPIDLMNRLGEVLMKANKFLDNEIEEQKKTLNHTPNADSSST